MRTTLEFPELLRLIDERSAAFRAAVAAAPGLDAQVPTCPEWTVYDLARHLGEGRRAWAATIAAGPGATAKAEPRGDLPVPREREALDAWLADSTRQLLDALREAGPDRGCWAWWGSSQSPRTCAAAARRQLHEMAVHTYDAQLAAGAPQPLPQDVALDGAEEFLATFCATTAAWPHAPAVIDYHAAEGRSWRNRLSGEGSWTDRLPAGPSAGTYPDTAHASVTGPASDLVLVFYDRIPPDSLRLDGDRRVLDQFIEWDPEG